MKKLVIILLLLLPAITVGQFLKSDFTNIGKFKFTNTDSTVAANLTRWYNFEINATESPAGNAEVNSGYFAYNWSKGDNQTFTANALEGVFRSRGEDEAVTGRGVYGRFYIDPSYSATLRTGIGGEFSARAGHAGGEVTAENGTAFVGTRIWMAPYFTDASIGNVNNFHGLWIHNETSNKDVTNAIFINSLSPTGGSFTNFLNFYDGAGSQVYKLTKEGKTTITIAEAANATDETRYFSQTVNASESPAGTAEVNSGYFAYNWSKGDNQTFTVNALEGVFRSRGTDEAITGRGVYGRFYIDPDSSATLRTGIGGEFSARAGYPGGEVVAENGTAFVGARIWMAPYFTDATLGNINNSHGLWIVNEATDKPVTNAIKIDATTYGSGFTYAFNADAGKYYQLLDGNVAGTGLEAADASTNGTDIMFVRADDYRTLTSNKTYRSGYFRYNVRSTTPGSPQTEVTGIEGVGGMYVADGNLLTLRGAHLRTYIPGGGTASAKTSVGADISARVGEKNSEGAALSGTAFVGARIWMAPWFDGTSMANINNFHGLWIYNEHDSADVTNAIFVNSATSGGSFTNFLNFEDNAGATMFKITKDGALIANALSSFEGTNAGQVTAGVNDSIQVSVTGLTENALIVAAYAEAATIEDIPVAIVNVQTGLFTIYATNGKKVNYWIAKK